MDSSAREVRGRWSWMQVVKFLEILLLEFTYRTWGGTYFELLQLCPTQYERGCTYSSRMPFSQECWFAHTPVARLRASQPDSDRLCRGRLTVCQRHRIDCLLAIDLALVVAAVTDKSLLSGSKAGYVATTWPCACASERDCHWFTWVRPMVQLANSLALRKANWNRERTMMI